MILLWLKHRYHTLLTSESGMGVMIWVGIVGATIASVFNFTNTKSSVQQQHNKFKSMSVGETIVYDISHAIRELIEDHAVSDDNTPDQQCDQLIHDIIKKTSSNSKSSTNLKIASYTYDSTTNEYPNCLHVNTSNQLYRDIATLTTKIILAKEHKSSMHRHISVKVTGSRKDGGTIAGEFEFSLALAKVQQHFGFIFFNPDTTPLINIDGASSNQVEVIFKSPVFLHDTDHKINALEHIIDSDNSNNWDTNKLIFQGKFMTSRKFFDISDAQSIGVFQSVFTQGILVQKFKGKDFLNYLPANIFVKYGSDNTTTNGEWDNPEPIGFTNFQPSPPESDETYSIKLANNEEICDKDHPPVFITDKEVTIDLTSTSDDVEVCALIKTTDTLIIDGLKAGKHYQFYGSFIAKQLELKGTWSSSNETTIEFNLAAKHGEFHNKKIEDSPLGQFFNMPMIAKNQWIAKPDSINDRLDPNDQDECNIRDDNKFSTFDGNCAKPDLEDQDEWTDEKMKQHVFFVQ